MAFPTHNPEQEISVSRKQSEELIILRFLTLHVYPTYLHVDLTVLYVIHRVLKNCWRPEELNNLLKSHSKSLIRIKNRIYVKQQNRAESKVIGKMPTNFKGTTI